MIHKNILCAIQLQFIYVHFSLHYSIQFATVMQQNDSLPNASMLPDHVIFVLKMFLTPKSFKNLPIPTPTQMHGWNIDKADIIIRQIGKKFGVMKLSMCMIFHLSNSG